MSPTSTTTANPAEILLAFVMSAVTLSDEQKDLYIAELLEGRLHPELEANLTTLLATEEAAQDSEIAELKSLREVMEEQRKKTEEEFATAATKLVTEHEKSTKGIVMDFKGECSAIERQLNSEIELAVKDTKEKKEEDAVRAFLMKKKS